MIYIIKKYLKLFKFKKIINILFPRYCICCYLKGDYLCRNCKKKILSHPEMCPYCHRFSKDYTTCIDCKMNKDNYLEGLMIGFSYSDTIKTLIIKLKYNHRSDVADFFASRLQLVFLTNQYLQNLLNKENKNIIVSYIPSHWRRYHFVKGYNQSLIIARSFAQKCGFKFVCLSKKTKNTKSQAKLNREQRLKNLINVFKLKDNNTKNIVGNELFLLIDDITTTGSTINFLAKSIKIKYPNCKIRGIVVGRKNN